VALDAAVASMTRTNAAAAQIAVAAGATGATDVTGFGLLGHAGRMAQESEVDIEISVAAVPIIEMARALAVTGIVPGGTGRNLGWVMEWLDIEDDVDDIDVTLLADAQTSGGLVFGVDADKVPAVLGELATGGHTAAAIGTVVGAGCGRTHIIR